MSFFLNKTIKYHQKKIFTGDKNMSGLMWLLLIVLIIAAIIAKIKRSARVVVFKSEDFHKQANDQNIFNQRVQGLRNTNVEQMVSCEKCGIYVPASEVIFREGKVYCCEEHIN